MPDSATPDQNPPPTFLRLPRREIAALGGVAAAILGASDASPYEAGQASHSAAAPAALRAASIPFARQVGQHDLDLDRPLLRLGGTPAEMTDVADCGDVPTDPSDPEGNRARIEDAVRRVLAAGAVPVLLGGDDSVPIPMFRAYEGRGPLWIVQVDAHVDWGDVIRGNPLGYGSTMRRAAELPFVGGMVQVGLRGLGSGTVDQLDDARAWGARFFPSRTVRRAGMAEVLAAVPDGAACLVTIDCDGLDPTVMPAVNMPTPGGLGYEDVLELMRGVAAKARIAGFALVEFVPDRDPHGLAALTAARLVTSAVGLIQAGRDGPP